ncbi:Mth938-like domain-containing protein [Vogesella urethralis]|uniref:Mth938-like domain-containing protein n=1 Tax=Vogesella urethralis TaxID=2592656 RepID=UPI001184F955|nr:Mth938-like domain-containing protein [Vogesella urethralis]
MKLHESNTAGANLFTAHGAGYVEINRVRHQGSLVVTADSITPWPPASFEALEEAHFSQLLALQPELVIFGSGSTLRFPHPRLSAALTNAGIGVEVMDTSAACRTYNILLAEDRRVVAALLGS